MGGCHICPQDVEVINTFEEPVVTETSQARAAVAGRNYFLTTQRQTVANNASIFLQITNPAGSGRTLHIGRIAGTANTNTIITLNRNGSFAAAGTPVTPVNSNFGSATTSVATAKFVNQVADPTVGGVIFQDILQPATGGITIFEYDGQIVMPSGTTFVIRLINNAGGGNILSLNVSFWETTL
ncbi:hypothetical protein ABES25_22580 [Bacillus gobiensis]|uniref:hypothetical protein n=1 Tax=Bacillus gobiensis TaxID=1441095 RepID=UPI003D205466